MWFIAIYRPPFLYIICACVLHLVLLIMIYLNVHVKRLSQLCIFCYWLWYTFECTSKTIITTSQETCDYRSSNLTASNHCPWGDHLNKHSIVWTYISHNSRGSSWREGNNAVHTFSIWTSTCCVENIAVCNVQIRWPASMSCYCCTIYFFNTLKPALHFCGANADYRCDRLLWQLDYHHTKSPRVFQPIRIVPAPFSGWQSRSFCCISH